MNADLKSGVQLEIDLDAVPLQVGVQAVAAERGGATRIELCSDLLEGGITPSAGLIELVRARTSVGLQIMIRPRGGDFCYNTDEFETMQRDILAAKKLGADGVVLGVLHPDARVDIDRTRRLVEQARPLTVLELGLALLKRFDAKKAPPGLDFATLVPIPISARFGDNVIEKSANTPWYNGPSLLDHLETVDVESELAKKPFRLPVQCGSLMPRISGPRPQSLGCCWPKPGSTPDRPAKAVRVAAASRATIAIESRLTARSILCRKGFTRP